ncbi:GTP cyclohydrolase II [Brettanomyces nanus]|uniref:GTP cyclohydrolase II n=1 Tax=Eeniella nana TaxID=13502 RepID=A0A875RXP9_EENNA|nr:GTP cyclohydrolase II [Brettanomyces nanus]QPG73856.1 GTP cyclohydrolase II [Brettanomyces nanus]
MTTTQPAALLSVPSAEDMFANMPLVSPTITPTESEAEEELRQFEEEGYHNATAHHHRTAQEMLSHNVDTLISDDEIEAKRNQLPDLLPEVECIARARIPTTQGPEIFLHMYSNNVDKKEHLAIIFGEDIRSRSLFKRKLGETQSDRMTRGAYVGRLYPGRTNADKDEKLGLEIHFDREGNIIDDEAQIHRGPTLVRIHSECYTGETAWSARCDCGEQFDEAGRLMGQNGHGCIVYLRQEGRGIGLGEKLKAYNLQDLGSDTVQANLILRHPADKRSYSLATAILIDLGLFDIRLLTNNPDKIIAVEGKKRLVKVVERVPMIPLAWQKRKGIESKEIEGYLRTKIERMGHLLSKPTQ